MRTRAAVAALSLAACGGWVAAQENAGRSTRPQATFRADVNYVEVDVIVTDAAGRFVPGLTAADFELSDSGRPQKIDVFHEVDVPVAHADRPLFAPAAIHPDVTTNLSTAGGRVYLLLLDDLHTAPAHTLSVKRHAREFVERYLGSNDLAAVLHTSGRGDVSQDFTSDRSLLLRAIDGFMGRGLTSAMRNRMEDFNTRQLGGRANDNMPARDWEARERVDAARATLQTVRDLATYLASLSGRRKALLLFSEGIDVEGEIFNQREGLSSSDLQAAREAMLQAVASATRANVHVYAIDATGLGSGAASAEISAMPTGAGADAQGLTSGALADERRRAHSTLRTLAAQTGGIAIVDTNGFDAGFSRIQRENSTYYLLGFYPTTERDGKFHRLEVRALRPGLQVRARAGYHATRTTAAAGRAGGGLRDLLAAAVPSAGLPMRVAAPAFKRTATESLVLMAVEVPGEVFRFEADAGLSSEDLEMTYQVVEPGGKIVAGAAQTIQMRLRQGTRDLVEQRGFRVLFAVNLKPGRYQARIAATTRNGSRRGSVFTDLVVPDFFASPLVWSGVALTSAAAAGTPARPPERDAAAAIPALPTAMRTFPAGDTLALYAEAYDNDVRAPHDVDITAVVRDDAGRTVFSTNEVRSSSELGGGRGGYGVRAEIPLGGLPAGAYVLTLTARSRASGAATASRDIPFAIS